MSGDTSMRKDGLPLNIHDLVTVAEFDINNLKAAILAASPTVSRYPMLQEFLDVALDDLILRVHRIDDVVAAHHENDPVNRERLLWKVLEDFHRSALPLQTTTIVKPLQALHEQAMEEVGTPA